MILAVVLVFLAPQEDSAKWIRQLGSDLIEEREEAARRLQDLGEAGLPALRKARDESTSPEVQARLDALIARIVKMAELAKALGPTRRVTIAARGELLKEVLAKLTGPAVATPDPGPFDPESRIDFQVAGVTWWEALDRVARKMGARYDLEQGEDSRCRIKLIRGKEIEGPVVYAEQFRISVVEAKRHEFRRASSREQTAMVVVEARHQPDLKPGGRWHRDVIRFDSVTDAKGEDAKSGDAGRSTSASPRPYGLQECVWVRFDAALPLTITGRTDVSFPSETREIALDLEGAGSKAQVGDVTFQVAGFAAGRDSARVTLNVAAKGDEEMGDRLEGIFLVNEKGERFEGHMTTGSGGGREWSWRYEFTSGIEKPKRVAVRWVMEYYRVELPFRLEGVKLPDLK